MNPELQQIFDSTPEDKPRSRLEPYRELILRWRRQGRTYRRICALLHEKCGVQISYLPLYEFVQRRDRPRKPAEPDPEASTVAPTPGINGANQTVETVRPKPRRTPEEIAALRESARSVNQPVSQEKQEERPRFHYDPKKPLVNKNYL